MNLHNVDILRLIPKWMRDSYDVGMLMNRVKNRKELLNGRVEGKIDENIPEEAIEGVKEINYSKDDLEERVRVLEELMKKKRS